MGSAVGSTAQPFLVIHRRDRQLDFKFARANPYGLTLGLDMVVEIHDLAGEESALVVTEEEAGEYEVEYLFGDAGTYEMHVEIDVNGVEEGGEFHLPILSPDADEDDDDTGGGHGH